MKPFTLLKGLVAATLLLGAPAAIAQEQAAPAPSAPAQEQSAPAPGSPAQAEVSDGQIDRFVNAYQSIQTIQQTVQADLVAAVEAQGLTVEDYVAIAEASQSPETVTAVDPAQAEQFAAAAEQVAARQATARQEMQAAIEAEAMTIAEFEEILNQAQQDPVLQAEIVQRLEDSEP